MPPLISTFLCMPVGCSNHLNHLVNHLVISSSWLLTLNWLFLEDCISMAYWFMLDLWEIHPKDEKGIVHYIKGTYQLGIKYCIDNQDSLGCYTTRIGQEMVMTKGIHFSICFIFVLDPWFGHARNKRWFLFRPQKHNIVV